jgi:hypothetical protein
MLADGTRRTTFDTKWGGGHFTHEFTSFLYF